MIKDQNKVYGKNQYGIIGGVRCWKIQKQFEKKEHGNTFFRIRRCIEKFKVLSGGGKYNQQGQRNGKWIEFELQISQYSQITHNGLYQDGKKVNQWDIYYRKDEDQPFELIGSRLYDEAGNMKIGKWNEISLRHDNISQVMYQGEYSNQRKVAKWDILYRKDEQIAYKQLRGGLYDEEGSNKIGYQTELSDEFIYESQIVFYDEYQNGKKVSKWIIREEGDYFCGETYNQVGLIKVGKWIELKDGFDRWFQAIYYGQYKDGNQEGILDIFLGKPLKQQFELNGS